MELQVVRASFWPTSLSGPSWANGCRSEGTQLLTVLLLLSLSVVSECRLGPNVVLLHDPSHQIGTVHQTPSWAHSVFSRREIQLYRRSPIPFSPPPPPLPALCLISILNFCPPSLPALPLLVSSNPISPAVERHFDFSLNIVTLLAEPVLASIFIRFFSGSALSPHPLFKFQATQPAAHACTVWPVCSAHSTRVTTRTAWRLFYRLNQKLISLLKLHLPPHLSGPSSGKSDQHFGHRGSSQQTSCSVPVLSPESAQWALHHSVRRLVTRREIQASQPRLQGCYYLEISGRASLNPSPAPHVQPPAQCNATATAASQRSFQCCPL